MPADAAAADDGDTYAPVCQVCVACVVNQKRGSSSQQAVLKEKVYHRPPSRRGNQQLLLIPWGSTHVNAVAGRGGAGTQANEAWADVESS
jgi:hypothetical protein